MIEADDKTQMGIPGNSGTIITNKDKNEQDDTK